MASMRERLFVRVDPGNSYPIEMTLESRPLPGFPDHYVIACRRTEDMGISDPSNPAYESGRGLRMGTWNQPVSKEFARKVVGMLEHATVPWSVLPDMLDGPPISKFVVKLGRTHLEWQAYGLGDDALSRAIQLMVDAVEKPVPVLVGGPRVEDSSIPYELM